MRTNVIQFRRSKSAGDPQPQPQRSDSSLWGLAVLFGLGYAVLEGARYMVGNRQPVLMPGARIRRNPITFHRTLSDEQQALMMLDYGNDARKWPAKARIAVYAPLANSDNLEAEEIDHKRGASTFDRALAHERAMYSIKDLAKAYKDAGNDATAERLLAKAKDHARARDEAYRDEFERKPARKNPFESQQRYNGAGIYVGAYEEESNMDVFLNVLREGATVTVRGGTGAMHVSLGDIPVQNGIARVPHSGLSMREYMLVVDAINRAMPLLVSDARKEAAKTGMKLHMFKRSQTVFAE